MILNEKTKTNQEQLVEAIFEITQSEQCEIKFSEIIWVAEKPILKLKGLDGTPNFIVTFGIDKQNPKLFRITSDSDSESQIDFEMTYSNFKKFKKEIFDKELTMMLVRDIMAACCHVMLKLGVNCYLAHYNGEFGTLKITPENKVVFLSDKSIEIEIDIITDTYLMDSFRVFELPNAILIETDSDNSYYIALERAERFGIELAERRMKLDNVEPLSAS